MDSIFFIFLVFASTTLAMDTIPAYHFGPDVGDWVKNSAYYRSKGIADPVRFDENNEDDVTPEPTRKIDTVELDALGGKRGYEVYEYLDDTVDTRPAHGSRKVDPYYKGPMELNTPVTPNVSDLPKSDDHDLAFGKKNTITATAPSKRNKAVHIALGIRDYFSAVGNGLLQNFKELLFNKKGPISYFVCLLVNMFTTPSISWSVGHTV